MFEESTTAQQITITVPKSQSILFNAILDKLDISAKLTAKFDSTGNSIIYTGALEPNERKELMLEVEKLGMGSIIKTTIGVASAVVNKVVSVAVNDLVTPTAQEVGKLAAKTAKTAGVGAVKIGASLFNTGVNSVKDAKHEITHSDEWAETRKIIDGWMNKIVIS